MLDRIAGFFRLIGRTIGRWVRLLFAWAFWPFIAARGWYVQRTWMIRLPILGLIGLVRLWKLPLRPAQLTDVAATLGSDVPFFLSGLETALGTGRGDRLQHVTDLPRDYGVVLVPSDRGLSTADVYAECEPNEVFEAVRGDLLRGVHTARDAAGVARLVANDLQAPALRLRPELADVLAELRDRGALAAAVSGSGPTVFAIVEDRAAAERMAAAIPTAIPSAPL